MRDAIKSTMESHPTFKADDIAKIVGCGVVSVYRVNKEFKVSAIGKQIEIQAKLDESIADNCLLDKKTVELQDQLNKIFKWQSLVLFVTNNKNSKVSNINAEKCVSCALLRKLRTIKLLYAKKELCT